MSALLVGSCTPTGSAFPRALTRGNPPVRLIAVAPVVPTSPELTVPPTTVAPTTTTSAPPPPAVHIDANPAPTYAPVAETPSQTQTYVSEISNAAIWACILNAESGDNPAENTGNGYYGAAQWLPDTWDAAAEGAGFGQYANGRADLAPADVQQAVAVYWQSVAGWGQWGTAAGCGA